MIIFAARQTWRTILLEILANTGQYYFYNLYFPAPFFPLISHLDTFCSEEYIILLIWSQSSNNKKIYKISIMLIIHHSTTAERVQKRKGKRVDRHGNLRFRSGRRRSRASRGNRSRPWGRIRWAAPVWRQRCSGRPSPPLPRPTKLASLPRDLTARPPWMGGGWLGLGRSADSCGRTRRGDGDPSLPRPFRFDLVN